MVYHRRGDDWGTFAKGFSEAFAAMLKLGEDKRYHEAIEAHWLRTDAANAARDPFLNGTVAGARTGFREGVGGSSYGGGGGGNLAANQAEAYNAARSEGLSDSSARALVANMSGEALSDPGNMHWDGTHNARGIVQWDDQRSAAIQKQFGKMPNEMSVTDQTKAAIWEMKTNPSYKASWDALNSDADVTPKIRTLVTNYERPGDPDKAISQRITFAGRLPTTFKGEPSETTIAKAEPTVDGKPAVTPVDVSGKGKAPDAKVEKADARSLMSGDASISGSQTGGDDIDWQPMADRFRDMPTSKNIEDRRQSDPTAGGVVDLGIRGRDVELDEHGQPTAFVSPEGRQWAATHLPKDLPTNPIADPGRPAFVDRSPPGTGEWRKNADGTWTHISPPSFLDTSQGPISAIPPTPTQLGPESPYAPPDQNVYNTRPLSPSDQPSSGVGVSVHDSRQGPPQRTGAPPNVGPTPSSIRPQQGPPFTPPSVATTNMDPRTTPYGQGPIQGPPLPPRSIATTNLDPRTTPYEPPAPVSIATTNLDPKTTPYEPSPDYRNGVRQTVSGRTGPAEVNVRLASGERDERTTPDADKPAPAAIPVSATAPTPRVAQPQGGGQFVMVDRPNADPTQRDRGSPQGTALNLSSLWGPNPPLSQRGQAAAATPPVAAAPSRRPDDYSDVASMPPQSDYDLGNQIMGQAKGGAVRRYANGGAIPMRPVMKMQGGGNPGSFGSGASQSSAAPIQPTPLTYATWNSPTSTTYVPAASQPIMGTHTRNLAVPTPDPSYAGFQPWSRVEAAKVNDPSLTPDQKTWYQQQIANAQSQNGSYYYNPASMPTTAAPAAPAPAPAPAPAAPAPVAPTLDTTVKPITDTTVVDPTTTAGTGAPGIPNAPKAKSYDPNVDAKTGAGFANTNNAGGTNYTIDEKDTLKTNDQGQITGYRHGGPTRRVSRYAGGGAIPLQPTMKFAAGGTLATFNPNYSGPTTSGGWTGTPYTQLAPNQQAWADATKQNFTQQRGSTGGINLSLISSMPDAVWPTAPAPAPAAPAPAPVAPINTIINAPTPAPDPNNQPGAGVPGVPDTPAPTPTPDPTPPPPPPPPIVDPSIDTVTNTPTNPVPKQAKTYDPTQDTAGKYASGGKDTGNQNYQRSIDPNSASSFGQYDYGQIQGFDDGGEVNPSAFGMPPGLSGGQQPPPPLYYNGATYAPAGAPVGKGMTQNSLPTQIGMAIPTLPMLRGGMVRRYADGGEVDDDVDVSTGMPNIDIEQGGRSGSNAYAGAAPAADPYATATSPQEAHPDLPAWTPQVNDGQGNPSRGLVGAIAGGLHYLASQLGLGGGGQQGAIASDPNTQANRRSFSQGDGVPGAPMPSHAEVSQIHQSLGLNDGLHEGLANLAGMEAARNFYLVHGDPQKADMMAASMLQYSVGLSRDYGDQAVKRYYANDLNGAVHAMVKAKEAIADGTLMNAQVSQDGQSVNIEGTDLNGKRLWAKTVAPEAILGAALHTADGSLAWHMYEIQAAKYDPATANIIKQRQDRAQQEEASGKIAGMGPQFGAPVDQSQQPSQPQLPIAAPTPAPQPALPQRPPLAPGQTEAGAIPPVAGLQTTPPLAQTAIDASRAQPSSEAQAVLDSNRGRSPDTTTAQPASPPASADSNQVAQQDQGQQTAPPAIPPNALAARAAIGPQPTSPTLGVVPTREAGAALPSIDAQETSAETENARLQQITAQIRPTYFTSDNRPIVGGQPMNRPPLMDTVTFKKYAPQVQKYYQDWWQQFNQASQENTRQMQQDINAQKGDYVQSLNERRRAQTMTQQETLQSERMREQEKLIGIREAAAQAAAKQLQIDKARLDDYTNLLARQNPRQPQDMEAITAREHPMVTLARNMFDTPEAQALTGADDKAGTTATGLIGNAGYSASEIHTLGQAYQNGLKMSPLTDPNDVAEAVGLLGRGVSGFGKPDPRTGDVNILAYRADGSSIPLTLSPAVAQNLKLMGDRRIAANPPRTASSPEAAIKAPQLYNPGAPALPPAPVSTPSAPTRPDFWSGGRQSVQPGPALRLPERVPVEAMPEEQRRLYPELQ